MKKKDNRGSSITNIEPVVDMCIRDVRSSNNVILKFRDMPLSKANIRFEEIKTKYGIDEKKTLWEHWEIELIEDIKVIKKQLKEKGLIGSIKEDFIRRK